MNLARSEPPTQAQALSSAQRERLYDAYVSTHAAEAGAQSDVAFDAYVRTNFVHHLPANASAAIADIACGSGALLASLRRCGYACTVGVDRGVEQVQLAARAGVHDVTLGDACTFLGEHAGAFHAILAIDFLEHLSKDEALDLLWLARAALRPGGRIIVQTCNAESPMFGRIRYGDLTHETAFTQRSIRQAFLAAGLSPVAVRGIDPAVYGRRSFARSIAWRAAKLAVGAYLTIETGAVRGHIVSQNLIAVAERPLGPIEVAR